MSKVCKCKICGKRPSELSEFVALAESNGYKSAEEAVMEEEGTYNNETGEFYCTICYIKIGMPLGTA